MDGTSRDILEQHSTSVLVALSCGKRVCACGTTFTASMEPCRKAHFGKFSHATMGQHRSAAKNAAIDVRQHVKAAHDPPICGLTSMREKRGVLQGMGAPRKALSVWITLLGTKFGDAGLSGTERGGPPPQKCTVIFFMLILHTYIIKTQGPRGLNHIIQLTTIARFSLQPPPQTACLPERHIPALT